MGGTPIVPSAETATTLMRIADDEQVFALAAADGHAYSAEEKDRYREIKRLALGEFNMTTLGPDANIGDALKGIGSGGVAGTTMNIFQSSVKFIQEFFAAIKAGVGFGDAAKQAFTTASAYGIVASTERGLSMMNVRMKQAGQDPRFANLGFTADLVTGMRVVTPDRVVTMPDGDTDMRALDNQIFAAIGTAPTGYTRSDTMNLNPDQQRPPVTVVPNARPVDGASAGWIVG